MIERSSQAPGVLGELAFDDDLKEIIAPLPRLEEGLLFLQVIEISGLEANSHRDWYEPISSTKALTILFLNPGTKKGKKGFL